MAHPTVETILAGEATQHLARCESCRRLAGLFGAPMPVGRPDELAHDLEHLPRIDDSVYVDWAPLAEAKGGMGRIFRARDRRLGRLVAIKQLRPDLPAGEREALVRRFEREARLTARLQHPAIVGVHEAGRFGDGEPFYAMPLLRGVPLDDEIAKRPTVAQRLGLLPHLTTVADAVAYAHEQGIVHRDIKPANILIGAFGETVLIDWGLAKEISEAGAEPASAVREVPCDGLTRLGIGTPQYMPPEQARGETPDPRVDVYALGATLYHVLAGVPPYGTSSGTEVRRELATTTPRPLAEIAPDVPRELIDIVERAMARDPAVRFSSAQALAGELRRYQTGQLLTTRRYTLAELIRHFARRHRTALRIAAIAAIVLVATAVAAFVRIARERDRAETAQRRAERELRRAQGTIASQKAGDPAQRLDALALGVGALGPELRAGDAPVAEALQGLVDALAAGPPLVPLEHTGLIKRFALAGDRLLGVDDARALVVWDATSGRPLARYTTSLASPELLAVSPDHERAVVCGLDARADVFHLATGARASFDAAATIIGCAFLPDGRIVTAAEDVTVRDAHTLAMLERYPLPSPASSLELARTGLVAVSTLDGTLWVWQPGGKPRTTRAPTAALMHADAAATTLYMNAGERVNAVALDTLAVTTVHASERFLPGLAATSSDGRYLSIGMWDRDKTRRSRILDRTGASPPLELDGITGWWTDRPTWVYVEHHGPLSIVDVETGGAVLRLEAHADEASHYPAGDRLMTASRDGPAFLWDLSREASGSLLGHTGEITAIATCGSAVLTASRDGTARVWRDAGEPRVLARGAEITVAAWVSDSTIALGDLAGDVRLVDTRTGRELARARAGGPISALAVTSTRIALGALDGTLELRDAALAHPIALASPGAVTALAFSPDGTHLASAHGDGSTQLWDARTGRELARAPDTEPLEQPDDHDGHAWLAFAPDGERLLAARPAGHTLVLDARHLAPKGTLEGRLVGPIDRGRAAAATVDGSVLVHDLARGTAAKLAGHRFAVLAAAFSPDGARLATASIDGSVRIWDLATGATIVTIRARDLGPTTALAFAGDAVVTGYASGGVRVHPTTPAAALARACTILARFGRAAEVAPYCE